MYDPYEGLVPEPELIREMDVKRVSVQNEGVKKVQKRVQAET